MNHMRNRKGFTLVELLIVLGMLGVVMTAIYSLFSENQRSAYIQEDVLDVQQNLRIAMESISRDVKMSGFLIPTTDDAVTPNNIENRPVGMIGDGAGWGPQRLVAPDNINSDLITLNTGSPTNRYARVAVDTPGGAAVTYTVDDSESVDTFDTGEDVRIIRPMTRVGVPADNTVYTVTARDRDARTMTLTYKSGVDPAGTEFTRGDVIVGTTQQLPSTISYCLGPWAPAAFNCGIGTTTCPGGPADPIGTMCLFRIVNGVPNLIATNITGLQFRYLLDNGNEVTTVLPAQMNTIRAVRVNISGRTIDTARLSRTATTQTAALGAATAGTIDRSVTTLIRLRNR